MKKKFGLIFFIGCCSLMWQCKKDRYEVNANELLGKKFIYTSHPDHGNGELVFNDTIIYHFARMDSVAAEQRWYDRLEDGTDELAEVKYTYRELYVSGNKMFFLWTNNNEMTFSDPLFELEWHVQSITDGGMWVDFFANGKQVISSSVFLSRIN